MEPWKNHNIEERWKENKEDIYENKKKHKMYYHRRDYKHA